MAELNSLEVIMAKWHKTKKIWASEIVKAKLWPHLKYVGAFVQHDHFVAVSPNN